MTLPRDASPARGGVFHLQLLANDLGMTEKLEMN